jgi:hypothetical protein
MNSKIIRDIHWECHSKVSRQQCVDNDYLEHFAAAIIRECVQVDLYWLCKEDRRSIAEKIKQHFGVA